MKSRTLSKSDIKDFNSRILAFYNVSLLDKKDSVALVEDKVNFLKINGEIAFFFFEDGIVPCLKFLQKNNFLKKVVVDMGAVKFLCSGADLMRPGVVDVDPGFEKGDFVCVVDVDNKMPLMVGKSLFSSGDLLNVDVGKVVLNIHFVGDDIWKIG